MIGRIAVSNVGPVVACGTRPAKAVAGETLPVRAVVLREGHDAVGATVVLRSPDGKKAAASRLREVNHGLAEFLGSMTLPAEGKWTFTVEGWADPWGTWLHGIEAKLAAGQDVALELEEGALLLERAAKGVPRSGRAALTAAAAALREDGTDQAGRVHAALTAEVTALLDEFPVRDLVSPSPRYPVDVERPRALYGSWYEFFPRSEGASLDPPRSGTFVEAAKRLPAIAEMGFDVVYLPPIHPIGHTFRKGRNNTLAPGPGDPGVPWAIGSEEGGHDAIHPDLGTLEDFDAFVAAARDNGLEVALDLALQCSPDHPWIKEHPEWFTIRADGSIAYAENPPKKYQDIYPLNFDTDPDGLYAECLRITRHWLHHGVRIFRVDNPHTKPFQFWEWLIAEIRKEDPGVIFLAEAFTRPPTMHTLAQIGFTQSYTYFTWRNAKWELEEYLSDLTSSPTADYMRPNFFVNTPDILHAYLQYGGPAAFKVRAVLAATMSPTWGVYSGYELYEHVALRPGSEEYLDSEKYQYRPRDWAAAEAEGRTLAPYLTMLNRVRRTHPALHWLRNLRFHATDSPDIIAYSKSVDGDTVLVVVNLEPHAGRETTVHLDMPALGFDWFDGIRVTDEISGAEYLWGAHNYVRLDPFAEPAHIFTVRPG